jgi:spore coat protein CotF
MTDDVLDFLRNQAASYRVAAKTMSNPEATAVFQQLAQECDRLAAEYEQRKSQSPPSS